MWNLSLLLIVVCIAGCQREEMPRLLVPTAPTPQAVIETITNQYKRGEADALATMAAIEDLQGTNEDAPIWAECERQKQLLRQSETLKAIEIAEANYASPEEADQAIAEAQAHIRKLIKRPENRMAR